MKKCSVQQYSVLEALCALYALDCLSASHWISVYIQTHTRLNSSVLIFPLSPVRIQKGQVNQLKCLGGLSKDKVVLETVKSSGNVFPQILSTAPLP